MNKGGNLPHGKEAWKHLEMIINRGYSRDKVFHDWLDLMLNSSLALTDNMQRENVIEKLRENTLDGVYSDRYMAIVKRYEDGRPTGELSVDHFASATGALM